MKHKDRKLACRIAGDIAARLLTKDYPETSTQDAVELAAYFALEVIEEVDKEMEASEVLLAEISSDDKNIDQTDAATNAFDAIAVLCGVSEWEYPGQVVRDVERLVSERDEALAEIDLMKLQARKMRDCVLFFSSVIKSGEPWTDECQKSIKRALEKSKS